MFLSNRIAKPPSFQYYSACRKLRLHCTVSANVLYLLFSGKCEALSTWAAHPVRGSLLGAVGLAVLPDPGQGSSKGRLQRELLVPASPHCHPQSVLAG